MEWYSGRELEDLVVPEDEEIFYRVPSPDSWSPWGKSAFGSFACGKKLGAIRMELPIDGTTFSSEVDQLDISSDSQGSHHDFCGWSAYPHEESDFQLDNFASMDEADDKFLHSLLEEGMSGHCDSTSSVDLFPTACQVLSPSKDQDVDPNHVTNTGNFMGNSNNLNKRGYPPLVDCEIEENDNPVPPAKARKVDIPVSYEHCRMTEHVSKEEASLEETALLELRKLAVQMTDKTRICFRDALYRLAENSNHQANHAQDGDDGLKECIRTASEKPSRLWESSQFKETETNAIDRAVADLLFKNMNFGDVSLASILNIAGEFQQARFSASSQCVGRGSHGEVRRFSGVNLLPPQLPQHGQKLPCTGVDLFLHERKLVT